MIVVKHFLELNFQNNGKMDRNPLCISAFFNFQFINYLNTYFGMAKCVII